jgi:hypothetical protein
MLVAFAAPSEPGEKSRSLNAPRVAQRRGKAVALPPQLSVGDELIERAVAHSPRRSRRLGHYIVAGVAGDGRAGSKLIQLCQTPAWARRLPCSRPAWCRSQVPQNAWCRARRVFTRHAARRRGRADADKHSLTRSSGVRQPPGLRAPTNTAVAVISSVAPGSLGVCIHASVPRGVILLRSWLLTFERAVRTLALWRV